MTGDVFFASDQEESYFNALWVATVLNLDYPSSASVDEQILKKEAIEILDYAESVGMNAVILQVRPTADSLFKSDFFPWSDFLTGEQGLAPHNDFDPLQFWVEEAHKRGLELHAWINPYRITRKTATEKNHDYSKLHSSHPALKNPHWVVEHTDGNLYFNPGHPEVIDYMIQSIEEIIRLYAVDGIHFDDYFYPGRSFDDQKTFEKFGASFGSIEDWRRENVNELIRRTHELTQSQNRPVVFGVSPFGIWANEHNHPQGSATRGLESYFAHYADTKKWVEEGWLDYIAPQLYWHIGFEIADYELLLNWWSECVKDTEVKLYIGQGIYRINSDPQSPWYGIEEVKRQLVLNESNENVHGSLYFRYQNMKRNPELTRFLSQKNNPAPVHYQSLPSLVVSRPNRKQTVQSTHHYIGGYSDPKLPLKINGKAVANQTEHGYFGVYYPLKEGVNEILVSNGSEEILRTIIREKPKSSQSSGQSIRITPLKNHPLIKVEEPFVNAFSHHIVSRGERYFLYQGMMDYGTHRYGQMIKLKSGLWVNERDIKVSQESLKSPRLRSLNHSQNALTDKVMMQFDALPIARVESYSDGVRLSVYNATHLDFKKLKNISEDSLNIKKIHQKSFDGLVEIDFELKDKNRLVGYHLETEGNALILYIRSNEKANKLRESKPLAGKTILIDPGHGGKDIGAIGLLGEHYPEKKLALDLSLKLRENLEAKGASVHMTRDVDMDLSLKERVEIHRQIKPDLLISIHADSASDTIDLSKVKGYSVFYYHSGSKALADKLQEAVELMPTLDRKAKHAPFYVLRDTISPSVLIEAGFMSHPQEFQRMSTESYQMYLTDLWGNLIEEYFR